MAAALLGVLHASLSWMLPTKDPPRMSQTCPSESYEQERFVIWLEENSYKFTSIPNGTFTRSWAVKARNKREGLRAGFPDLLICLKNRPGLCMIEMKRRIGGRLSTEQNEWIAALNRAGTRAVVCYGFDDAKRALCDIEKEDSTLA